MAKRFKTGRLDFSYCKYALKRLDLTIDKDLRDYISLATDLHATGNEGCLTTFYRTASSKDQADRIHGRNTEFMRQIKDNPNGVPNEGFSSVWDVTTEAITATGHHMFLLITTYIDVGTIYNMYVFDKSTYQLYLKEVEEEMHAEAVSGRRD